MAMLTPCLDWAYMSIKFLHLKMVFLTLVVSHCFVVNKVFMSGKRENKNLIP